jgi:PAS domain S-box-containing protein
MALETRASPSAILEAAGASRPTRRSMAWTGSVALLVTMTLVLAVVVYADYQHERRHQIADLQRGVAGVSWILAQMLSAPLRDSDVPQMDRLLENALDDNESLQAIRINDAAQSNLLTGRTRAPDGRLSPASSPPDGDGPIVASSDIMHQGAMIGHVSVWATDRFEQQALRGFLLNRMAGILAINAALAVTLGFVFRRTVVLPLRAVEAYAFRVSKGEEDVRLSGQGFPAELENLRDSIERMVGELTDRYRELATSKAALAEAEERYRGIFENAIEGIYQTSIGGTILTANPAFARTFGYESPAAFLGVIENAISLYADGRDRAHFLNRLLREGRINSIEMQFKRKGGSTVWLSTTARLIKDATGEPRFISGMTQNITQRRWAEEALRESEKKYRALMESANDAVFLHTLTAEGLPAAFEEVNEEACRRLGYAREVLTRMHPQELDDPRYRERIPLIMAKLRQDGVAVFETAHMTRDGRSIPVEVSSRYIELQGRPHVLSIARDITERKRAEEALLESEARLRTQLDSILSPEADIDSLELARILEVPAIQSLLDVFAELTGASLGLIDLKGKVLVPAGWQDVCTQFHRVHAQTREICVESNTRLTQSLKKGEYVAFKCGNNMWHVFTPLYIGDRHVANIFVGQFFYEDEGIDPASFLSLPERYGFDRDAYLRALARVPRFSRYKVEAVMEFLVEFADMVSSLGYTNLKLAKALWDQKRVEEDLRQNRDELTANQEKLSLAMDMANLVPWEYDYASDLFKFDNGFFALFGTSDAWVDDGYMTPEAYAREYLLPEQAYVVRKGIINFSALGTPETSQPLEHSIRRRDGEVRATVVKCTLIRDAAGRPCKIIGATQDITEHKLVENALRESEARYRGLVENLPVGISVISADMRVLSMNAKMREWNPGVDPSRLPICFRAFNHPPRETVCDECPVVRTFQDGLPHEGITNTPGKDGIRNFRIIASPLRDARGDLTGVIEIVSDITKQMSVERAIFNSERKYRTLLESIPLNIIYKDRNSVYRSVNAYCAKTYGLPLEAFPGKTDFVFFDRELAEKYQADDQRIMSTGHQEEFDQAMILRGREKTVHTIKTPIRDEKGQVESILVIFWDVTEAKRTEAAMREAEKMAAVGTLAGGVAHDFNNILGSIANLALLARRDLPPDGDARMDLEQILESANVGKELVHQLLTFRRPGKEIRRAFNPAAVVSKTIKLMRPSFPPDIDIHEALAEDDGMILADPSQFHQVVLNLCTNAVDAMRGQPGRLSVSLGIEFTEAGAAAPHPSLFPGRYMVLRVGDTGPGIDPAIKERIFEPFFSSKPKRRGTGLGLAVVHGIASRHNGAVTVQSRPGAGTVFTVYFPACDMEEMRPDRPSASPVRGTGRILLVDDEIILAESGQRLMEDSGYNVTVCTDGSEALAVFRQAPEAFDLVMTDLSMPGVDGKALAMEVLALRPELPVILCTGYGETFPPNEAWKIGIREYITKPVDWNSLSAVIDGLLRNKG